MKVKDELFPIKRTQRDYSLSFKLQVVSEIENEELSISGSLRKYGRDRNCYLSLITDAYSKKIMGYDLSDSLAAESAIRALKMANRKRTLKVIH